MFYRIKVLLTLSFVYLFPLATQSFAGEYPISLNTVLKQDTPDLSIDPPDQQARTRKAVTEYLKIRELKINHPQKRTKIDRCIRDLLEDSDADEHRSPKLKFHDPFCPLLLQEKSAHKDRPRSRSRKHFLTPANFKKLLNQDPAFFGSEVEDRIISNIRNIEWLNQWVDVVLNANQCPSTRFITELGFRTEKEFPSPEFQKKAIAIYERAMDCGEDDYATKAAYRLGLIYIWQKQYSNADRVFSKLLTSKAVSDYESRVLYWRYFCAVQLKNKSIENEMKDRLLKNHPLAFHTLMIDDIKALNENPFHLSINQNNPQNSPKILLRSKTFQGLNPIIAAAELLLSEKNSRAAVDLLGSVLPQLKDAEAEVQLYIAALLTKGEDFRWRSQLLLSLFKDYTNFISKETLSLLYPLDKLEFVQISNSAVDPYLVISLIRQESAFNARAKSRAGAIGLMQLMPRTAKILERKVSKSKLLDPTTNVRIGVKYFSKLVDRFDGDMELALAAYNAGAIRVEEWVKRYTSANSLKENRLLFLDLIPFKETREYVAAIVRNYYWYSKLYPTEGNTEIESTQPHTKSNTVRAPAHTPPAPHLNKKKSEKTTTARTPFKPTVLESLNKNGLLKTSQDSTSKTVSSDSES